jgi:hypothetical protein
MSPAGCDYFKAPKMAIPTTAKPVSQSQPAKPVAKRPAVKKYMGKTSDEWGQTLSDADPDHVRMASVALRVLGAEGRPYLIQGLESSVPETRRMCLENLSVSDLRGLGSEGRSLLVKLAGDRSDLRIRELAARYLIEWDRHIPSPQ